MYSVRRILKGKEAMRIFTIVFSSSKCLVRA